MASLRSGTRPEGPRRGLVDRAASLTGGGTGSFSDQATRRFRIAIAVIIVLGIVLIGSIRSSRQYAHPTVFDSWQNAYSVFDCETESWLPPIESMSGSNGIRTRADGIIYIEPTDDSAAGDRARLGVFLDNVSATLTDSELILPDGTTLEEEGMLCRGEEAELQVIRWDSPAAEEPTEVRTTELASTKFEDDRQALAIVLAPRGASIPLPPSAELLPEKLPAAIGSA